MQILSMRRSNWARAVALVPALFGLACDGAADHAAPVHVQTGATALLHDGRAEGGTSGFFFLPPLLPAPSGTGAFEARARTSVEIVELDGAGTPASVVRTFEGAAIRVDHTSGTYQVNWHTGADALRTDRIYRIRVLVPGRELGFVDVQVASTGKGLRNLDTSSYVGLVDGRTLPIKFRIDAGVLDADGDDLLDYEDNCPAVANAGQEDGDADGTGDACQTNQQLLDPPSPSWEAFPANWVSPDGSLELLDPSGALAGLPLAAGPVPLGTFATVPEGALQVWETQPSGWLAAPVVLRVRLDAPQVPGSLLLLWSKEEGDDPWALHSIGRVSADGNHALAWIEHFSYKLFSRPISTCPSAVDACLTDAHAAYAAAYAACDARNTPNAVLACRDAERRSYQAAQDACITSAGCTDGSICRAGSCAAPFCGDGFVDVGEACDAGDANSNVVPDTCRVDCTLPRCGDAVVDTGENCDEGPFNGTGICRFDCTLPICGDGIIEGGEACDDGNSIDGDGCDAACRIEFTEPGTDCSAPFVLPAHHRHGSSWGLGASITEMGADYVGSCGGSPADREMVIEFTAAYTGTHVLYYNLLDFPGGGILYVWDGTCGANEIVCTDAGMATLHLTAGQTIYIVVDGPVTRDDQNGSFGLTIEEQICGNGFRGTGETCDDGNAAGGDGCSATCQVERGYTCTSSGCFANVCGDGLVGAGEACDDGNFDAGDGCSPACTIEGDTCADPQILTADPNGNVHTTGDTRGLGADYGAGCAQSNFNGDLFYSFTAPFSGRWHFTMQGDALLDGVFAAMTTCGVASSEIACTDSGGRGRPEQISVEVLEGETIFFVVDGYGNFTSNEGAFTLSGWATRYVSVGEACDPAGTTAVCNAGLRCDVASSTCVAPVCGDGIVEGDEPCDDGNNLDGDGCSASCTLEPIAIAAPGNEVLVTGSITLADGTWVPPLTSCTPTNRTGSYFFDAYLLANDTQRDQVVDLSMAAGAILYLHVYEGPWQPDAPVGCLGGTLGSSTIRRNVAIPAGETRVVVVSSGSAGRTGGYTLTVRTGDDCGDGVVGTSEQCDDGGRSDGDGCSASCTTEPGYTCTLADGCYRNICGDGIVGNGEICDDGDLDDWNACSNACQVRGDTCAAPFDLRLQDEDPAPDRVLASGDLSSFANDHVPACAWSSLNLPDVVYDLRGNGTTTERWEFTLVAGGTGGLVLDIASACVPRNAQLDCVAGAKTDAPKSLSFVLGPHETVYLWVDAQSTGGNRGYELRGVATPIVPVGGACDPSAAPDPCGDQAFCSAGGVCEPIVCGDGVVQGWEECDDGNSIDDDACTNHCYRAGDTCNAPFDLNARNTSTTSGVWRHTGDWTGMKPDYVALCSITSGRPDVVYAFTAPQAGTYTFRETGPADVVLYAAATCPETGDQELTCADAWDEITLPMTAGQTVFVHVDPWGSGSGVPTNNTYTLEAIQAP